MRGLGEGLRIALFAAAWTGCGSNGRTTAQTRGPRYELCGSAAVPSDDLEIHDAVMSTSHHRVAVTGMGPDDLPDAGGRIVPRLSAWFVIMPPADPPPRAETYADQVAGDHIVVEGSVIPIDGDRYCVLGIAEARKHQNGSVWIRKLAANAPVIPATPGDACQDTATSPDDVTLSSRSTTAPCIARRRVELEDITNDRDLTGPPGPPEWAALLLLFDPATSVGERALVRKGEVLTIGDARYSVDELVADTPSGLPRRALGRVHLHKLSPLAPPGS